MVSKLKRKSTRKNHILEKRPHAKDLLVDLEKVLEKHFGEKVFFSKEKKTQINMENLSWDENLSASDLGCEDGECTGTVEFNMFLRIKNE
jgi:succinate dehydrogenase/fumarate reductase-like Fe-S protein